MTVHQFFSLVPSMSFKALPSRSLFQIILTKVAEVFTNNPGKLVPIDQTISGFKEILDGKYDHLPEVAFYMVGNIDEVNKRTISSFR